MGLTPSIAGSMGFEAVLMTSSKKPPKIQVRCMRQGRAWTAQERRALAKNLEFSEMPLNSGLGFRVKSPALILSKNSGTSLAKMG